MRFKLNTSGVKSDVLKKCYEDWNKLPLWKRVKIQISNRLWFIWRDIRNK